MCYHYFSRQFLGTKYVAGCGIREDCPLGNKIMMESIMKGNI